MKLNIPNKIGRIPTLPLAIVCLILIAGGVGFATLTTPSNQLR